MKIVDVTYMSEILKLRQYVVKTDDCFKDGMLPAHLFVRFEDGGYMHFYAERMRLDDALGLTTPLDYPAATARMLIGATLEHQGVVTHGFNELDFVKPQATEAGQADG